VHDGWEWRGWREGDSGATNGRMMLMNCWGQLEASVVEIVKEKGWLH